MCLSQFLKWYCVVDLVCHADYYSCYFSGNIFVCAEVSIVLDVFSIYCFFLVSRCLKYCCMEQPRFIGAISIRSALTDFVVFFVCVVGTKF